MIPKPLLILCGCLSACYAGKRADGEERYRMCVEPLVSGLNTIYPDGSTPVQVFCDMGTDDGNWTVFQRRWNNSVDFYRNWTEYQQGFGDLNTNYWLGLDALYLITSNQECELRVDLVKFDGTKGHAQFGNFYVTNSSDNYRLYFRLYISGDADNSLMSAHGSPFSTYDADHDSVPEQNCAEDYHSAWWYGSYCLTAHLNGRYRSSREFGADGMIWLSFDNFFNLKISEMKLRKM